MVEQLSFDDLPEPVVTTEYKLYAKVTQEKIHPNEFESHMDALVVKSKKKWSATALKRRSVESKRGGERLND